MPCSCPLLSLSLSLPQICDILEEIQDVPLIAGENGKLLTIKEAVDDLKAYTRLNDSVLDLIDNVDPRTLSGEEQKQKLSRAKALFARMNSRQTYK